MHLCRDATKQAVPSFPDATNMGVAANPQLMRSQFLPRAERLRFRYAPARKRAMSPPTPCRLLRLTSIVAVALLARSAAQDASAGPITPTYLAAGVQTPNFPTACGSATSCYYGTETFSSWAGGDFTSTFRTGTSNFDSSTYIRGVYSANGDPKWTRSAANQYGGASGTTAFPSLTGATSPSSAYVIRLSTSANIPGVNYFGLWISALDANNSLQFYSGRQLLYSFGATDLQTALGACSVLNVYCGNPTTPFKSQNSSEAYAYVNFFATVGYFDTVVLYQTSTSGFESSNHAVGYINPVVVNGTTFSAPDRPPSAANSAKFAGLVAIPEPATVMLVFTTLVVLILSYQLRRAVQAIAEHEVTTATSSHRKRRRRRRSRPTQFGWPAMPRSRFSA